MGIQADGQRLARMAKVRLYSHEDGGPAYSVNWHWQGWRPDDGTVEDQSGGSYTGDADEVIAKVMALMVEMHAHMVRGIDPFPTRHGGELVELAALAKQAGVTAKANGHAHS